MPEPQADDPRRLLGDPPTDVQVTVVPGPRQFTVRTCLARIPAPGARLVIAIMVLGTAIAALAAHTLLGGQRESARSADSQTRAAGPAGVAAAYGYPLSCLAVTIAPHDPRYARADYNRAVPCGRYGGYGTAIFHRVDGVWVRALDATSYACPVRSLPTVVQVELAVCP